MRSSYANTPNISESLHVKVTEQVKRSVFEEAEKRGQTAGEFVRRAIQAALDAIAEEHPTA